jgi:hypothetical protein
MSGRVRVWVRISIPKKRKETERKTSQKKEKRPNKYALSTRRKRRKEGKYIHLTTWDE